MDFGELINAVPLWALFALTAAFSLVGIESGTLLAKLAIRFRGEEEAAPLGSLVGAILGLLAFILAFTFGVTTSRFDTRRQLVMDEAVAIRTSYLKAGLLPPARAAECRRLLKQYVEVRVQIAAANLEQTLTRSVEIQQQLWSQTEMLVAEPMDSEIRSLFISSVSEIIGLHQRRETIGLVYRIPGTLWLCLYLLSLMSMLCIGYQVGMSKSRRPLGSLILAAAFSLVIVMIADIDRPAAGNIRVSQQPLRDVQLWIAQGSP
jgi:hypothetical protein